MAALRLGTDPYSAKLMVREVWMWGQTPTISYYPHIIVSQYLLSISFLPLLTVPSPSLFLSLLTVPSPPPPPFAASYAPKSQWIDQVLWLHKVKIIIIIISMQAVDCYTLKKIILFYLFIFHGVLVITPSMATNWDLRWWSTWSTNMLLKLVSPEY